jgi:hypothetical protein
MNDSPFINYLPVTNDAQKNNILSQRKRAKGCKYENSYFYENNMSQLQNKDGSPLFLKID